MKTTNVLLLSLVLVIATSSGTSFASETLEEYCEGTKSVSRIMFCDRLIDHESRLLALENNTSVNTTINTTPIEICDTIMINGICDSEMSMTLDIKQGYKFINVRGMISEPNTITIMIKDYSNDLVYVDQIDIQKQYSVKVITNEWKDGVYFIKVSSNGISETQSIHYSP